MTSAKRVAEMDALSVHEGLCRFRPVDGEVVLRPSLASLCLLPLHLKSEFYMLIRVRQCLWFPGQRPVFGCHLNQSVGLVSGRQA